MKSANSAVNWGVTTLDDTIWFRSSYLSSPAFNTEAETVCLCFHYPFLFASLVWCVVYTLPCCCSLKEKAVIQLKKHSWPSIIWLQLNGFIIFQFNSSICLSYHTLSPPPPLPPPQGLQPLVSGKCSMVPNSRGGLCARWLPLRWVLCPGHCSAAWLLPPAAKNGLTGAADGQLEYWVTNIHGHTLT